MNKQNKVFISNGGFAFCRFGVAFLIWIAVLFKIKELVSLSFFILLFSAILTVKYAPLIKLWDFTLGNIIKTKKETVNLNAIRFAHSLGSIITVACVLLVYLNNSWTLVWVFAIIKTISAMGFCPASKVYNCMAEGTCCAFSKKMKTLRNK